MADNFEGQDFRSLTQASRDLISSGLKAILPEGQRHLVWYDSAGLHAPGCTGVVYDIHAAKYLAQGFREGFERATRIAQEAKIRSDRARRAARIGARKRRARRESGR